jgi:hypothetical protein
VVNFGQSWTATGGVVWASMSNWPTEVVQTTNQAVYGAYDWHIYTKCLEERYKVLNALEMYRAIPQKTNFWAKWTYANVHEDYETLKTIAEAAFYATNFSSIKMPGGGEFGSFAAAAYPDGAAYVLSISRTTGTVTWVISTNLSGISGSFYMLLRPRNRSEQQIVYYVDNGINMSQSYPTNYQVFNLITSQTFSANNDFIYSLPANPNIPQPTPEPNPNNGSYSGWEFQEGNCYGFFKYNFRYCTNKYW